MVVVVSLVSVDLSVDRLSQDGHVEVPWLRNVPCLLVEGPNSCVHHLLLSGYESGLVRKRKV